MRGAHFQCVNNHYAKFEYKERKLMELQIPQTRHHLSIFGWKKFNTPQNRENIHEMCTKSEVHIFNTSTIIMQSLNKKSLNFGITDYKK